ncbi:PD-(D/E)XK nuclease family protein [Blattabacterium cuenoti]|uniref:PD-(D/E)XK nuclease family protein n=1 Tax=Blattabacterium cuenoti TaxID=1653831 RepID=UPI001EEA76F6|nr:PD-(D/E)XK nuclease family protein [Blattabacterium cuenoti]
MENIKKKFNRKTTKFFTMEKLMEEISGLSFFPKSYILFSWFYMLKKEKNLLAKNFHNFFKWGPNILDDFQEIDYNLINIEYFFSYMISTEKIKKWNLNPIRKKYKEKNLFWEEIYKYYKLLTSHLFRKKKGYHGMIFRKAFDRLQDFVQKNKLDTKIIIVRTKFHLLAKYEEIFIKKIIELDKNFIELYNLHGNSINKKNNTNLNNIKIISVTKEIEQVKIVEKIVHKLIKKGHSLSKIILILGDNYLIFPLLSFFKKNLGINLSVSINYPIKNLPIHSTFYYIFQFLLKKEEFKNFSKKDILRILSDGYIKKFFFQEQQSSFIKKFNIENIHFFTRKEINQFFLKNDLNIIFQINTHDIKKSILGLVKFIRIFNNFFYINTEKYMLELKFLSGLEIYMQKIKILTRKIGHKYFKIQDLFNIYKFFIKKEKIFYRKKNPESLYSISFLDSFFENFETTIITSVNEGIIPPSNNKTDNSFIPIDIRKKFLFSEENDKFSYSYFMRLLENFKNVFLIYKDQADELNSGEKSRFIHQIEMNSNFSIKKESKKTPIIELYNKKITIVIKKTNSILKRLSYLTNKGLSPTSILLYNYNPLLFYYQKILGLQEEKISTKQKIGKIIHEILKILYHPIKWKLITSNLIKKMKKDYEEIIKKVVSKTIKNFSLEGENLLFYHIIKNYIENFISWEEKIFYKGYKILIKEVEFSMSTQLDIGYKKVNLYGIIDRIDECNGITRILDYKTGLSREKKTHVTIKNIENIFHDPNHGNTMQLLIYIYLWFQTNHQKKKPPIIANISLEKEKKNSIFIKPVNFFYRKKEVDITYDKYKEFFLPYLVNKITEILDPHIPIIEKKINNEF